MINGDAIRRRAEATVRPMRNEWDRIKDTMFQIARNMYPQAKRSIMEEVDTTTHRSEEYKEDNVLSIIPYEAVRKGAAGFFVNLMNPSQQWVHLENVNLTDDMTVGAGGSGSSSDMVEKLERLVTDTFSRSGSYRAAKKMIEHCLTFGFAAVLVKSDTEYPCKAQCLPVGTYSFGVDDNGAVCRIERKFAMNAEEIVREFGGGSTGREGLPQDVIENWKKGVLDDTGNYVIHNLIEPNETTYEIGSDSIIDYGLSKSMKYRSIYWIEGRNSTKEYTGVLAVRGFREKPIVTPRFDCELGSIYGRGRGQDALNACRGLQALKYDELEISSNRAEPALIVSNEFQDSGFGVNRGQINYANIGEQRSQLAMPVLPNPPTSDETRNAAIEFQQEIRAAFFNDEFATIDSLKTIAPGEKRTAAEINALKSENLLQLGGATMMFDHEGITPLVNLFVSHCVKSRQWRELVGTMKIDTKKLMPKYVSSLFVAQRMQDVNSLDASVNRSLELAGSGTQEGAKCLRLIDFDRYFRMRHKLIGASESIIKNADTVASEDAKREEALKAQMAQQKAEQDAQIALSQAKANAQQGRAMQSLSGAEHMLGGDMAASFGGYQ